MGSEIPAWWWFPPIALPSAVLALASGASGVWAGGVGGGAWRAAGGEWEPRVSGLPLTRVAALAYGAGGGGRGSPRRRYLPFAQRRAGLGRCYGQRGVSGGGAYLAARWRGARRSGGWQSAALQGRWRALGAIRSAARRHAGDGASDQ